MKKHISLIALFIALAIAGGSIGYAAFPVANQQAQTTSVSASAQAVQVSEIQKSIEKEISAPAAPATTGGGKSQVIALILAIVVGALGIHRFYLGYTWQGVVQLLTGGGCGIWALIDLIRIITGDLQPKDGSYEKTL
jgi:hypothetical protein